MPCDAVYKISLDLGQTNFDLLVKSLDDLEGIEKESIHVDKNSRYIQFRVNGAPVSIDHRAGKITVDRNNEHLVNPIKRNYSATVVKTVAKKYNWLVKLQKQKAGQQAKNQVTYVVKKRS